MELLTITGKDDKILQEREPLMDGLFPYHDAEIQPRPLIVKKPTVFLTSRNLSVLHSVNQSVNHSFDLSVNHSAHHSLNH